MRVSGSGRGGGPYFNSQHIDEPRVFAHALVDHMLMNAPPTLVGTGGPHRQVLICELAPDTQHFQTFGIVGVNQKVVSHGSSDDGNIGIAARSARSVIINLLLTDAQAHGGALGSLPASTFISRSGMNILLWRYALEGNTEISPVAVFRQV